MRVMRCPECGRVSSVAEWVRRPICVHAWDAGTPEIWDGAHPGDLIEQAPNEKYRTPGPDTWADMQDVQIAMAESPEYHVAAYLNEIECVRVPARVEAEDGPPRRLRIIHEPLEVPPGSGPITVALLDEKETKMFIQRVPMWLIHGDTVSMPSLIIS